MAYLGFLLSIMVCFADNEAGAKQSAKYEDLIYQSMNSIVTLDDLVTTLSVQVASLTTSLSSMQVKMEQIEKQNAILFTSLEEVNGRIAKETNHITAVFQSTQKGLNHLSSGLADLETSVANINTELDNGNKKVVVVSGEASNGHERCVKVCAGTTGRDTTNWLDITGEWGVSAVVDISACGFIKVPTVTTSIEGTSHHWKVLGTSSVYNVEPSNFHIHLYDTFSDPRSGVAKNRKWNVEWIAVGFTC